MRAANMIIAIVAVLAFLAVDAVLANEPIPLADQSKIRVGFYSTNLDTDVRLDASDTDLGTDIDFEDDLGFANSTSQFWVNGNWRLSERNYIDIRYVAINRSSTGTIDETINWGDQVFEINSTLDAFYDTDYLAVEYRRALAKSEKSEFGVSLGFGVLWLSTGIEAVGGPSAGAAQNTSVTAPFPVLGIHGYHQLAPKLYVTGSAEYFSAQISNIEGTVGDFQVGLDYYISNQFGLGLRYDYNRFEADVEGSRFRGTVDYTFDGVQAYAIYNF